MKNASDDSASSQKSLKGAKLLSKDLKIANTAAVTKALELFANSIGQRQACRVLVLGDLVVDRTHFVEPIAGNEGASFDGSNYRKKKSSSVNLGGAAPLADVISQYCPTTLICLQPTEGELTDECASLLWELHGKNREKLEIISIPAQGQRVCEVTRIVTTSPGGEDRIVFRFEDAEVHSLKSSEMKSVQTAIEDRKDASVFLLADYGRGTIDTRVASLVQGLKKTNSNGLVVVQPYSSGIGYFGLHTHTVVCRQAHLQAEARRVRVPPNLLDDLSQAERFFLSYPDCLNLITVNYDGSDCTAYLRDPKAPWNIQTITHNSKLSLSNRIGTRSMATSYYGASLALGLSERDSALVGAWACAVASSGHIHFKPTVADLRNALTQNIGEWRTQNDDTPMEKYVSNALYLSGGTIRLREAATPIKGVYTQDGQFKLALSQAAEAVRHPNSRGSPVPTLLIYGSSGAGKGYLAERIAETSAGRKLPMVKVSCQDYGIRTPNCRNVTDILDILKMNDGGIILLDEADKFQDSLPQCQSRFLEFLNSSEVDGRFVNVFVMATVSTDWESDITKQPPTQWPDFYTRFPEKIRVPELGERSIDIPYLIAHHFDGTGVENITSEALRAIVKKVKKMHPDFRSFNLDLAKIRDSVRGFRTIERTHLPVDYQTGPREEFILFDFQYS